MLGGTIIIFLIHAAGSPMVIDEYFWCPDHIHRLNVSLFVRWRMIYTYFLIQWIYAVQLFIKTVTNKSS